MAGCIFFCTFAPEQSNLLTFGTMKKNLIHTFMRSLSAKLSLWVVLFVSILFAATFSLMFYHARQIVRAESIGKAEDLLDKFGIAVINKLHEKEVVTRQTHWWVEQNLNDTVEIGNYIRKILDNEPHIVGIAAAFKHGLYPDRKDNDYMIYYHRHKGSVVRSDSFAHASYLHQQWYEEPVARNKMMWSEPYEDYRTDDEPIITYSIPLIKDGEVVGVYGVDISIYWLSQAIQAQRPMPSMRGAVVTHTGAFVIHSDTSYLRPRAMFRLMEAHPENEYNYTAYKMLNGESGISFLNIYGSTHLVAYKPIESKQYDIVVFCPENDIMGHYNYMISLMAVVVLLALVAIMVFCWVFIHRELHPLHVLEQSARMIKNGHYYTPIKASKRRDEVGSLTNSFIAMRQGIREHLANIAGNKHKLVEQNKQLSAAHDRIEEANKVKSAFLQNVSDQMIEPVNEISRLVTEVRKHHTEMSQEQIVQLANEVDAHTQTVTNLLTKVLEVSTKKQEGEA